MTQSEFNRRQIEDTKYMRQALIQAQQAFDAGEVPVGALLVDSEGQVIGRSSNCRRLSPDPTGHAEILVLRQGAEVLGRWNLSGCTLYVTLEPCPMCAGACIQSRVSRVVFGASDPRGGVCGSLYNLFADRRFNHRPLLTSGVLEQECLELLRRFFEARRRRRTS